MNKHYVGVDLGSINDYTAICWIERYGKVTQPDYRVEPKWRFIEYRLWHLERYLGEPYTTIVDRIQELLKRPELSEAKVIVDATGVGRPTIDFMKERKLKRLIPVTITGGDSVSETYVNGLYEWRVPKRDLVGVLQVLLQNEQLKSPTGINLKDELIGELQNFKVKLSAETGHDSYEAWRSGDHDDLVLSIALPLWYSEYDRKQGRVVSMSNIPI